ncbi:hypothetical protein Amsp01_088480 [Amycolatopsis sp. NBRC 101858]|nr:hypothetical protein Amsp01_088480 [Amycolatopsis sp. NBRC 101858]
MGAGQGPVTGRLLAEHITTGKQPEALRPFDPTHRTMPPDSEPAPLTAWKSNWLGSVPKTPCCAPKESSR